MRLKRTGRRIIRLLLVIFLAFGAYFALTKQTQRAAHLYGVGEKLQSSGSGPVWEYYLDELAKGLVALCLGQDSLHLPALLFRGQSSSLKVIFGVLRVYSNPRKERNGKTYKTIWLALNANNRGAPLKTPI